MTVYTVPTSITSASLNGGLIQYLPGHANFVAGTDVSDLFAWWLTRDPANLELTGLDPTTGIMKRSGTAGAWNTIAFQPNTEYPFEYGTDWGHGTPLTAQTSRTGIAYPAIPGHAFQYLNIDGQGATWRQADNTTYNDGILDTGYTGNATVGSLTVTISPPLTAPQVARAVGAKISGLRPGGTRLFDGSSVVGRATIDSCSPDGTTLTLAAGSTVYETVTAATITLYLQKVEQRRAAGIQMFAIGSPGAWAGVERACITHHLNIRNLTVRMGNVLGADSTYTDREQWHALFLRNCQNVHVESSVTLLDTWGDWINTATSAQQGLANVPLSPEDCVIEGRANANGRHGMTLQGQIGFTVRGFIGGDVSHWVYDSETTSSAARCFDTHIEDCAFDPGYGMMTQHPAALYGEPPRQVAITQGAASNLIVVPYDTVNGDDLGATITGTGIPAGTYLRRRMGPISIEVNQAVTLAGTVTATIGPAVMYRDVTWDHTDFWSTAGAFSNSTGCAAARAYFTGDVTAGSGDITNIVWDTRVDGLVYTTAMIGTEKVHTFGGTYPGGAQPPKAFTSTSITVQNSAGVTQLAPTTITARTIPDCTVTLNSRTLKSAANQFTTLDIGRVITGPGIRPGTQVDGYVSAKNVNLTLPASATVTGPIDEGRARFWVPLAPARWTGMTITDVRNIGTGKWAGSDVSNTTRHAWFLVPDKTDLVTVTRCYAPAALVGGAATYRMYGQFNPPNGFPVGIPAGYTWTVANNRWPGALDDQATTPTVTVSIVLTCSDVTAALPTFTATLTRSDGLPCRGAVKFLQDGKAGSLGGGFSSAPTGVSTFVPWNPAPTGIHTWQAVWAGSWDTLAGTSNTIVQNVGGVSPTATATALSISPSSPQTEATTITLTGTVTPDPGTGTVTFSDGTNPLGTGTLTAGVATLTTTLPAGTHTLTAGFDGNANYAPSTSTSATYTTTSSTPVDTTPPAVVDTTPADGSTNVDTMSPITVTFSETVTGVVFELRTTGTPFRTIDATVTGSGTTRTLTPSGELPGQATLTAVVDDAIDTAGNHLAGRVAWTFTTGDSSEYIPTGLLSVL